MKILITGANGFIGSHITRVLCKNHKVFALVRKNSNRSFIRNYPVQVIEGDLSSKELLQNTLQGMDLVVHAAAKVADWGEYLDFFEANVAGSLNLIDSLQPGTRMIFISSNAVMGEEDCLSKKNEQAPYSPVLPYFLETFIPSAMNHYRITKTIAEQMLVQRAITKNINLTILRPVWVYGPREFHAGPFEYCKTVNSGVPLMPGTTTNLFHVIYVEDLARIVKEISEKQPVGLEIYNIGNPEIPKMEDYWKTFCRELRVAKPYNIPKFLLYPLGLILEILWKLFKAKTPPLFTRARIYLFYANNMYNVNKMVNDLKFKDFTPLEIGVKKTVRWWQINRFIP